MLEWKVNYNKKSGQRNFHIANKLPYRFKISSKIFFTQTGYALSWRAFCYDQVSGHKLCKKGCVDSMCSFTTLDSVLRSSQVLMHQPFWNACKQLYWPVFHMVQTSNCQFFLLKPGWHLTVVQDLKTYNSCWNSTHVTTLSCQVGAGVTIFWGGTTWK